MLFGGFGRIAAAALAMSAVPVNPRTRRQARTIQRFWRGKSYPYSSTRQNARYARQMAAGQLKFV